MVVQATLGGNRLDAPLLVYLVDQLFLQLCIFEVVHHLAQVILVEYSHISRHEFIDDVALHLFVVVGVRAVGVSLEPSSLVAVVIAFVGALVVELFPVVIRIGYSLLPIYFAPELFLELSVFHRVNAIYYVGSVFGCYFFSCHESIHN